MVKRVCVGLSEARTSPTRSRKLMSMLVARQWAVCQHVFAPTSCWSKSRVQLRYLSFYCPVQKGKPASAHVTGGEGRIRWMSSCSDLPSPPWFASCWQPFEMGRCLLRDR